MNGYRKRWRSKIDVMLLLLGDLIGPPLLALLMRSCDVGFELPLALALDYLIEKMTWRFRYSVMRWRLVPVVPWWMPIQLLATSLEGSEKQV